LRTYKESTGGQDDDTVVAGRLGIEGGELVTDLLEGQALLDSYVGYFNVFSLR
jgi:hypothetical protein